MSGEKSCLTVSLLASHGSPLYRIYVCMYAHVFECMYDIDKPQYVREELFRDTKEVVVVAVEVVVRSRNSGRNASGSSISIGDQRSLEVVVCRR